MGRLNRFEGLGWALFYLCAWTSIALGQGATPPAQTNSSPVPNQNVEVIDLGPAPQMGFAGIFMNRDYRHIAIVGPSGSRAAAFLDGNAGDKYEQIQTVPPVLSPDGRRMAYGARKGAQWFMVVDGKEFGPYANQGPPVVRTSGGSQPMPFEATPRWPIVFSPDSKHVAFIANKGNQSVVVEDGKEITPIGAIDTTANLLFSKQGDHLAAVVRDLSGKYSVVVDGVEGPKYQAVSRHQFSDDGHHLLYVASKTPAKYVVVVDGKEGVPFDAIGTNSGGPVLFSTDGARVAYQAYQGGSGGASSIAVIDGKIIPAVDRLWMTPDGKTLAYQTGRNQATGQGAITIVVNGKPGLEYAGIQDLHFAPDGHVIYSAIGGPNAKTFVVDGEKESGPYDSADLNTLHFSADGKHVAYAASLNTRAFVVLDGKKLKEFTGAIERAPVAEVPFPYRAEVALERMFQFTPDGHVVYHANGIGDHGFMKDDRVLGDEGMASPDGRRVATIKTSLPGASTNTAQVTLDGQTGPVFGQITRMAFSPDGKHFAYVGTGRTPIPNGTGREGGYFLVVDGVQKGDYPEIADIQFSPDSQHLFHFVTSHLHGGPGMAYMDQQLFFTFHWLPGYDHRWLDDGHTLEILGGKYDAAKSGDADGEMYRVRYFLPGANRKQDTAAVPGPASVDLAETRRMLGSGAGVASTAAAPAPSAPGAPAAAAGAAPAAANVPAVGAPTAQNLPPAGTAIQVRMLDAVDSGRDPAGKQYRATVTRQVNAGNMVIGQGAAATVTLARTASGWTAQLFSLVINGQVVAVTSSSANVTGTAPNAAANAANSVIGVFGGNRNTVSSAVAAVAAGQRVVLPPGTSLSFVLSGTPAGYAAPAAPDAQPTVAAAAPAVAASSGAGGSFSLLVYCYSQDVPKSTNYFSAPFEIDPTARNGDMPGAFFKFLMQKYSSTVSSTCTIPSSRQENEDTLKHLADIRAQRKSVDTGWRLNLPPLEPGQSNPVKLQDRQMAYSCTYSTAVFNSATGANDAVLYVGDVFQADWNQPLVSLSWNQYIEKTYKVPDSAISGTLSCYSTTPSLAKDLRDRTLLPSRARIIQVSYRYTPGLVVTAPVRSPQSGSGPH